MEPDGKVNILLVDDHPENLLALEAVLDSLDQTLVRANSGEEALRRLLKQDFALILLDVQMPGMDGFETAALIRERRRSQSTPIIFLTAFNKNDAHVFKGYSLGAVDYLLKPFDPEILKSKVTVFVDLFKKTELLKRQATQLEATNTELRESEERLQDFLDNANDLIQIISPEGSYFYVNRTWYETLGYGKEAIEHLSCFDIIHPDSRFGLAEAIKSLQTEKASCRVQTIFVTKDEKQIPVEGNLNCRFENGKLKAIRCIFRDISEQKQAEELRAQFIHEQVARQEYEAMNRMKDEFIATLSHELRTPLNVILGWTQLLPTRQLSEERVQMAHEAIDRNAKVLAQLTEDLLDTSHIIRGKLRLKIGSVKLVSVIEAAIKAASPAAKAKGISIESSLDSSIEPISGDSKRLQQVVWNLLTNALKFTPQGGRVMVQLERVDSYAQIRVSDTGQGIKPEFLPYIFDRFRQGDGSLTRPHGGLGLGLAIIYHILALHKGTIRAESPGEGQGATFTVELPLTAPCMKSSNSRSSGNVRGVISA